MLEFLKNNTEHYDNLADIAYTLQVGREAMKNRVVFIANNINELNQKLKDFIDGKEKIEGCLQGEEKQSKDIVQLYEKDEDHKELVHKWITKGKVKKLAELWVKGFHIDWELIYYDSKPRRISLPTYPFAKERYWIPEADAISTASLVAASAPAAFTHPLLHRNTSDLAEQRFTSTFTGQEFFLADHVVNGRHILPGVAYLEMARAAVQQAAGTLAAENTRIRLKNIVWARPIAIGDHPVQVHIGLYPEDNGEIAFEIYSDPEDGTEPIAHSQGAALLITAEETPTLDLSTLQSECSQTTLSPDQCYEAFHSMGIDYGPAHRGLEQIHVGQGQVLARLSLPSSVSATKDQFVLHPSLLDAALQAAIGLTLNNAQTLPSNSSTSHKPALPFALQELEIFSNCTPAMWALVRYSAGSQAGDRVQKLDVDLCDDRGTVCVRMKGFTSRVLEGELQTGKAPKATPSELIGTFTLTPVWDAVPAEKGQTSPAPTDRVVIVGGGENNGSAIAQLYPEAQILDIQPSDTIEEIAHKLTVHGAIDHLLWIAPSHSLTSLADDTIIEEQNRGVLQVFRTIKALLRLGYGAKDLGWTIITTQAQSIHKNDPVNPTHAALYGLVGSMTKEYPNWKVRLIDMQADHPWPLDDIFTLPPDPQGDAWAYRDQKWHRQQLIPVQSSPQNQTLYRPQGVYVVIGGAGGIGEAWSEYMIRTYQAQIIWIGRRQKDKTIEAKLNRLAALGTSPHYITADATDRDALQQAYEEIKERYSQINGVIHSAIVLLDQSLANMEEERFRAGLSAKVDVSARLAQVFQKETLDFVLFFSSMISFTKDPGQSNYASGCTFKDAFAHQLSLEWPCAVKVMNWGYWGSVGIVASRAYQDRMAQAGVGSIEPPEAMDALEKLLTGPVDQVALMKTIKPLAMERVNPEELITLYPESIHSNIQNMRHQIPEQDPQIQLLKTETNLRMQGMDELLCRLLFGQLQSLGLFTEKNTATADLKAKAGLRDLYDRWLAESMAVLTRNNYLSYDKETYTVADPAPIDIEAAWQEWDLKKRSWLEDSHTRALVTLIEATLRALPDILTGKRPATDIMFPNSSMELVEGIYKNNPVADYFNDLLADTLIAYIEARLKQDPTAQLRIIEIGAGTGGTSATVFKKLKPYRNRIQEYCYTDISKAFLLHAEKEYGPDNPYLTCQIFNVEAPLAGQNISAGGYDVAIATNVLHATRNIRQTLRNAKAALKKNGLLILNELSGNALFSHLTFGLLEGWWLYEDATLRIPGCPGLSSQAWQAVLEDEGFQSILFPAQEAHELGQQIIVAESDGVVRQKQLRPGLAPMKRNVVAQASETQPSKQKHPARQTGAIAQDLLLEKGTAYFKKLIGETLKIPGHKIDSSAPLETYGIDSILVVQLNNALRKAFGDISSTLFFEYQTIDALVEHFVKTQKDSLAALVGLEEREPDEETPGADELPALPVSPALRRSRRFLRLPEPDIAGSRPQPSMVQDIAIIGLAGRYPGAGNVNEFWRNLKEGRDCITEIPQDRWDHSLYFDEDRNKPGKTYSKWGGFIEGVDEFDPLFFNISPREAEIMDPQERLFLEVAYASIEDAGYTPTTLCDSGKVGVFAGVMNANYPTGSSYWSIANRISYLLNFQGPSMAVDTACSSSLTAIHLALDSLRNGLSECAIAGGVNLIIDPVHYVRLTAMTMLSSDDQCKSFGDQADGFVDGEGVGAIVLKPLQRAIADGDHIYGVIKGTAINHGGKTNGYTVPNPNAQAGVIGEALKEAGIDPRTISYIEAHGTGTSLGDPIEITGLTKTFQEYTNDRQFCAIGSVKSNIGHCESAAGIAGVTKVLLQMKHRQLVPSLHSETLNPNIDFVSTPFVVQQELAEWKRPVIEINGETREYPRIAGISSFGAGGSNAHVIIEEYIPEQQRAPIEITTQNPAIIVLSAKNKDRLKEQARQLLTAIQEQQFSGADLADLAYTLQVGREAMDERLAVIVGSSEELEEKLKGYLEGQDDIADLYRGQVKRNRETLAVFAADEELQEAIGKWLQRGKYAKLLDLWVKGLSFDWNQLYPGAKPNRISLPTYPFARERYWMPETGATTTTIPAPAATIHPLLHRNTSDLSEQRFSSTFTGREFFLADHLVQSQHILPGVAYLEMARAAVEQVAGTLTEERSGSNSKTSSGRARSPSEIIRSRSTSGSTPRITERSPSRSTVRPATTEPPMRPAPGR